MRPSLALIASVLISIPSALQAQPTDVPRPSRAHLREIQLEAYSCSRENTTASCQRTRALADPLMDHPGLAASCKDALWELLQAARATQENSFQRRDSIDGPARRLTLVCSKPEKPSKPASSNGRT